MKFILDSVITVEDPDSSLVSWCNRNLIIPNPQHAKLVKMGKKAWGVERNIVFYTWFDGKLILPRGLLKTMLRMYPDLSLYENRMNKCVPVQYNSEITLRNYQKPAVPAVKMCKQGVVVMPCGAGKTETALQVIAELGQPALWITHTNDLLKQSLRRAVDKMHLAKGQYGVIGGGEYTLGSHITFSTVQSLRNKDMETLKHRFGTVVVDECHRAFMSPNKLSMFQQVIGELPALYRIGITASEHRSDGLICGMHHLLGGTIYEVGQGELKELGNVISPRVYGIPTGYLYQKDKTLEFGAMIADMVMDEKRNKVILERLQQNRDRYCLVLSDRLAQLEYLYDIMRTQTACEYINGKSKRKEREKAIGRMREGKSKILFATYSLAKEGLDIPRLEAAFLTTPYRDPVVVQQSVGRIMRPFDNKKEPDVYDFVDECISLCVSQFKSRKRVYRKLGCAIVDDVTEYQIKMKGCV